MAVNEVVEHLVLPLVDCGTDGVEVWIVEVGDLVVPLRQFLLCGLLGEALIVEEAPQGMANAVGLFDVRIEFEQEFGSVLLTLSPFVRRYG